MACQTDSRAFALTFTGSPCQLQVALEHLWDSVHAPVAERATTRERWYPAWAITVDAAKLDEPMRLTARAESENLQP